MRPVSVEGPGTSSAVVRVSSRGIADSFPHTGSLACGQWQLPSVKSAYITGLLDFPIDEATSNVNSYVLSPVKVTAYAPLWDTIWNSFPSL